ncbi:dihydrodipicolinate synthase family protein [Parapedobacter deserti]|uniref:Dihydrodipicolinate synthase family protein n=1 Tax=Parapedobacter deserti TaxID=1912957 RepID=A0ABV7JJ26_9SPHI
MERNISEADWCRGNWGTLLLPINEDDSIDFERLSVEIDVLIDAGVDGIYSNGTAGEFHTQTEDEFYQVSEMLATKCKSRGMRFQIGASHPVPVVTLSRIARTLHLEPAAYQVILPDWVSVGIEEACDFLKRVAESARPVPIVLYNPPHAKRVLEPEAYSTLVKQIPELVSIKVLDGDIDWYERMRPVAAQVAVFVPGHHLASGVNHGVASGAYSNVACINPWAAQRWWQLMQIDMKEALGIEQCIQTFFAGYITPFAAQGFSNPALDKLLAAVGNWADIGTRLRWPYRWVSSIEVERIRKGAHRTLPGWFFETN